MLGQTLNKIELGELDKRKLRQISGVEYFKRHIHHSQERRLKKYVKDAAGRAPHCKRFIPLSDVEKPSMKGRVAMYMAKLTEEETKAKLPAAVPRRPTNPDKTSVMDGVSHGGSVDVPNTPIREFDGTFSPSRNNAMSKTASNAMH